MDAKAIVYVIDDDASVRTSLSRLIRSEGLDVDTFSSARDFLCFNPPDRPGCILLDLQMPEMVCAMSSWDRLSSFNSQKRTTSTLPAER